jgi:hypothetical protein
MNSINALTGFSNSQIHLGQSPHLIPPIVPDMIPSSIFNEEETLHTQNLSIQLQTDVTEAKDNLLKASVFQSHYANLNRSPGIPFTIGDKVICQHYIVARNSRRKGKNKLLSFSLIMMALMRLLMYVHAATSNYTLKLPNTPHTYPTCHSSKLKPFLPNDPTLFLSRKLS